MTALAVIDAFRGQHAALSNFGPGDVVVYSALEGREVVYPSGEHGFNVGKTLDLWQRAWVAAAPSPAEAKARGRRVTLRPGWDSTVRYRVMRAVVAGKFRPGTAALETLLATGDAQLVEGNRWHDQHWGDCRCGRPACAGPGLNWLGRLLMEHRDQLRHP